MQAVIFSAAPVRARDAGLTADEIAAAVYSVDPALDQPCRQKLNRLFVLCRRFPFFEQ